MSPFFSPRKNNDGRIVVNAIPIHITLITTPDAELIIREHRTYGRMNSAGFFDRIMGGSSA